MWNQKCIYLLQALQEYSPILVSTAMSILPAAMVALPIFSDNTLSACGPWYSRYLYIAAFLASKFNHYLVHGHFGLQRVAKLNARDIWCAPCKMFSIFDFCPKIGTHATFRCCITLPTLLDTKLFPIYFQS